MKKIININLSGRVIPIEDSAYEQLQVYIESLRRYFANEESRDEIINDIESRIAELMSDKVRKGTSCITDADVNEIASSMGRPEDFEAEAASAAQDIPLTGNGHAQGQQQQQSSASYQQTGQQQSQGEQRTRTGRDRLYRDTSDKFIGGVCSGIAAYMNVDPAIVRILFAIVTFGGFGLGFIAYIVMWIILPPRDLDEYSGKRLFRNPEEKVIGGVASGLAAYFGRSTTNIRLIFAAPLLLNILFSALSDGHWGDFDLFWNIGFSSITGTFILVYIILWIVLPEARTTYQKMEMRGEKVDVNTIRQNVKEGMDTMKERMKDWSEEVKQSARQFSGKAKEFSGGPGREFVSDVKQTVKYTGNGIGHAIGVLFKVFFLFIFGTIAFALFVAVIAILFSGPQWWPLNDFLWTSKWQQMYAWGTLIFFLLVPLIAFIIWVVRRIMNARAGSNYLGWTFGALWTLGWVSLILLITSAGRDFSRNAFRDEKDAVAPFAVPQNKLIVTVTQPELQYYGDFGWVSSDINGWSYTKDSLFLAAVWFEVTASPDSLYHVVVRHSANGRTDEEARTRAAAFSYTVNRRDSLLDLSNGFGVAKSSKYRLQQAGVLIQVPVGKKIRFDHSVTEKLNIGRMVVNKYKRRNVGININEDFQFGFETGEDYTMGIDGTLRSDNVKTESRNSTPRRNNSNYRYNRQDTAVVPAGPTEEQIQQQLEEEKRKIREESDRKIRDAEEKARAAKQSIGRLFRKKDVHTEGDIVGIPSPVGSLVL